MQLHRFTGFIVLLGSTTLLADDKDDAAPILCRGNYHSEEEAIEQLARMATTYSNLVEWKDRAASVRRQILIGAKLAPLPKRTPLNPIVRKQREYDGYSVESAAFEARPGSYVYGSLYRPLGKQGPHPAVLCPHGHARGPGGDWTKNTPVVEYPYIRNVYTLYGSQSNVENVHYPGRKHGYQYLKRQAMYPFMVKHLGLDSKGVSDTETELYDETRTTIETPKQMHVFDESKPYPASALTPGANVQF